MRPLEYYLTMTQKELFEDLRAKYRDCADTRVMKNGYILVKGEAPVMLLAHLDTVHQDPVKTICHSDNGTVLMSPQGIGGDDRCGVYALNAIYAQSKVKPWLLFTCDEEIGGVGASKFCNSYKKGSLPEELKSLKLLIEIDRKGRNDAVFYDCHNRDFEAYITEKGFTTAWGSFSDISYIAPALGVAAVNLSSGYYNAHTLHEYINRTHLNRTVKKVLEIVRESVDANFPHFEYVDWKAAAINEAKAHAILPGEFSFSESDELESELSRAPECLRAEYFALLDFYTVDELEEIRADAGDYAIVELCKSEFGEDYYGMFDEEKEEVRIR